VKILRTFPQWTAKQVVTLPVALVLWPIVANDYRLREIGLRPDRWHWADKALVKCGYAVVTT